jgi:hypothetical protein
VVNDGQNDIAVIRDKQWPNGKQRALDNGYRNITEEVVPGAGHYSSPDQVLAFCDSVSTR